MDVKIHPDASEAITKEDLICGVQGNDYLFCRFGDIVDADVITTNPDLKLIVTMALASSHIDVVEATRHKIPVVGRKLPKTGFEPDSIIEEASDLAWHC